MARPLFRRSALFAAVAGALLAPAAACTLVLQIETLHERPGGVFTVSTEDIALASACGAEPTVKTVTLTNTTGAPVSFTAVLAAGKNSAFTVSPASGTIEVDAQQVLTIGAKGLSPGAPAVTDSLLVQATALDAGATVKLREEATAPVLKIAPASVDFGKVHVGESADASITIENTGNGMASLSLESDAGFVFSPSTVDVPADASVQVGISFAPQAFGSAAAQIDLNASCGGKALALSGYGNGAATQITAGVAHTCALFGGGSVACWGYNEHGELGSGKIGGNSAVPLRVVGLDDAVEIAAGVGHTCAVRKTGKVVCRGWNNNGQIGNGAPLDGGAPVDVPAPVEVVGVSDAVGVAAGRASYAILANGEVMAWGPNIGGELGDGQAEDSTSVPVHVLNQDGSGHLTGVVAVRAERRQALALMSDGTATCWGANNYDTCLTGTDDMNVPLPVPLGTLADLDMVVRGFLHDCAIGSNGDLLCWGGNESGQIGDGYDLDAGDPFAHVDTPTVVLGNAKAAAGGMTHTCALVGTNGHIQCWGDGRSGQLGTGNFESVSTPADVPLFDKYIALAAGDAHTCVVDFTGRVYCWGDNSVGQVGSGSFTGLDAGPDAPFSEWGIASPTRAVGF